VAASTAFNQSMASLEKRVQRLERTHTFMLVATLAVALLYSGYLALRFVDGTRHRLSVSGGVNDDIHLSAGSDGPFIATHLIRFRPGQAPFALARLPEPLVFVESGSRTITREEMARLRWFDRFGEPVTAFYVDERLQALYQRPLVAKAR
jgi:hypothetical protein